MSAEMAREQTDSVIVSLVEQDGADYDHVLSFAEDVLDVRRTYNSDATLHSVALLVAFGGPTTWVTFYHNGAEVSTTWYCEPQTDWADCPDLSEAIFEIFDYWTVTP